MRAFFALTAAVAGLGLPVSGYFNHLFQFSPLTVERHAWMAAHNILGLIFTVCIIGHVVLNRRALLNHCGGWALRHRFLGREAVCAIALVAAGLAIFVGHALLLS